MTIIVHVRTFFHLSGMQVVVKSVCETGIGQCVGARNHKVGLSFNWYTGRKPKSSFFSPRQFFLNFCQAAAVLTGYVMGTLIAYSVLSSKSPTSDLNPQEIIIIAL